MGKTQTTRWIILGLSATFLVIVAVWIGLSKHRQNRTEREEPVAEDVQPVFEKKDIETMDLGQLKAYIEASERARNLYECERAYKRAIQMTQGKSSHFREFIDFKFGLAGLYLNSLWEYGQFGQKEKIPPALKLAIEIYDGIIASYPDSDLAAEAQFRKGEVFHNEFSGYWNRLHIDDAIREFQKVIERYPNTDPARRAKERLAALQKEQR